MKINKGWLLIASVYDWPMDGIKQKFKWTDCSTFSALKLIHTTPKNPLQMCETILMGKSATIWPC